MSAIQNSSSKKQENRGGFRKNAGRKGSGIKTEVIRVDARLIPFLNAIKEKGLDDATLEILTNLIDK